jgi:DNA polymerase I-like protein with 3'-5' exonuclease and polymerase domains
MVEYCKNDVRLTKKLFLALTEKMLRIGYSELSAEIEHRIAIVIRQQTLNGFYFDKVGALSLLQQLRGQQSELTKDIQKLFPAVSKLVKVGDFKRTKDGGLPAFLKKAWDRYDRVVINEEEEKYYYYSLEPFNIGSPQQRVSRLLEMGWEPQKFTKKGFPQVDEEALVAFSQRLSEENNPAAKAVGAIAEWLVLQGRSSMIETWLGNLGDDSRIHGTVMTCGATTRRMTHSAPNTANIPSGAKAKYGHECRSLWTVEPDKGLVLVGYDAAGLETAGLCHYLNSAQATEILLRPKPEDIHTANSRRLSEALGWDVDREWGAKTSWYAWLYGAYPPKLGSIVGASKRGMKEADAGEIVIDTFFRNVPGLKKLIESIQYEWKSSGGRLATIDGGFVICPSLNAALNYKIQSAGAIVMKLTSILLDEEAHKQDIPFKKVGDIHDEGQLEVRMEDAESLGRLAVNCITKAGIQLDFKVSLSGDFKIGKTWAETH